MQEMQDFCFAGKMPIMREFGFQRFMERKDYHTKATGI